MQGIELRARREALGLSQAALGRLLGNAQSTVSQWEAGTRAIPRDAIDTVQLLEDRAAVLEAAALDTLAAVEATGVNAATLTVWLDDEDLWAHHPDLDGTPAVIHRVAMARARDAFDADDDFTVSLVTH